MCLKGCCLWKQSSLLCWASELWVNSETHASSKVRQAANRWTVVYGAVCVRAHVYLRVCTIKAHLSARHEPQSYLTLSGQQDTFQDGKRNSKQRSDGTFPGGPVAKNPPSKAGDTGPIPGLGTKIPHAVGHLSTHATSRELSTAVAESMCSRAHSLQQEGSLGNNWRSPSASKKTGMDKIKLKQHQQSSALCV